MGTLSWSAERERPLRMPRARRPRWLDAIATRHVLAAVAIAGIVGTAASVSIAVAAVDRTARAQERTAALQTQERTELFGVGRLLSAIELERARNAALEERLAARDGFLP
jgi:hypothetical protein